MSLTYKLIKKPGTADKWASLRRKIEHLPANKAWAITPNGNGVEVVTSACHYSAKKLEIKVGTKVLNGAVVVWKENRS